MSGTTLSVNMPCDCRILPTRAGEGSTVMAGDPIVEVVDETATPVVQAVVSAEQAKQLVSGDIAELRFSDGKVVFGSLSRDAEALTAIGNEGEMRALIEPTTELESEATGSPVSVRIISQTHLRPAPEAWRVVQGGRRNLKSMQFIPRNHSNGFTGAAMQDVHPLILCGGIGTRLWPLSRTEHPKQFQRIDGSSETTFFHATVERHRAPGFADPIVAVSSAHVATVLHQLSDIKCPARVLAEPISRNTGPGRAGRRADAGRRPIRPRSSASSPPTMS